MTKRTLYIIKILIDEIRAEQETHICKNCGFYRESNGLCLNGVDIKMGPDDKYRGVPEDFGCNKFRRRI